MNDRSRLLLIGLIVSLAAACGDSTAPGVDRPEVPTPGTPSSVGRYALDAAAGVTLPALINRSYDADNGDIIDTYVLSDTLEITADGRYAQRARLEARIGNQIVGRRSWVDRGILSSNASALAFASDYLENVAFIGLLESTSSLRVQQDLGEGSFIEYRFKRLP